MADPTQDPEFMKAAPHEQMAYLSQTDPEFAKASPQDQLGYLMHVRGIQGGVSGPSAPNPTMQPSYLDMGIKGGTTGENIRNPQQPAEAFALQNPEQQSTLLGASAIGAGGALATEPAVAGAARTVARPIANLIAKHPILSSIAIGESRRIPGIGKYIPQMAEYLPFLAKGAAEEPPMQAEPPAPESNYQVVKIGGPKAPAVEGNNPYAGSRVPAMEDIQSTNHAKAGYHPDSQKMFVEYKNGKVYSYSGVPKEVYEGYQNAESQGSYFSQNIKGRYTTEYRGSVPAKPTPGQKVTQALRGAAKGPQ